MKRRKGRKYKGTYLSTFDLKIERACEFTECVNSSVARFARKFLSTFPRQQLLCSKARSEFQEELTQKLSSKPRDRAIDALCKITLIRFAGRHSSLASLHQHGRLPPAHGVPLGQADRRRSGLHRSGQEDLQHAGSGRPRPQPRVAGLRRLQRHPRRHRDVHVFGQQRVDIWGIICKSLYCMPARLCCIEIQVRSFQDRDQFLALYLARRSIFWVSPMQKILFPYTKDTFCGSLDTEPVSCMCIANPNFMYRAQPWFHSIPSPSNLQVVS